MLADIVRMLLVQAGLFIAAGAWYLLLTRNFTARMQGKSPGHRDD